MNDRRSAHRVSNAEIKAGMFLTFCLGLFVMMLFWLGKFGMLWKPHEEYRVLFTQSKAIRSGAQVLYDGMEIGTVRKVRIVELTPALLEEFPPIQRGLLHWLPLTDREHKTLADVPDAELTMAVRSTVLGRTMILLTLDVVNERRANILRHDDQYRILRSMMGDSWLDIRTGKGLQIPPDHRRIFIGVDNDMFADLGKSFGQVKDLLGMAAEVAGGAAARETVHGELAGFDQFLKRLEVTASALVESLTPFWDSLDGQLATGQTSLDNYGEKILRLKPEIETAMLNAQKALTEARRSTAETLDVASGHVRGVREQTASSAKPIREAVHKYAEELPKQVRGWREESERWAPMVADFERTLDTTEGRINEAFANARAGVNSFNPTALDLQEKTYLLKTRPWDLSAKTSEKKEALRAEYLKGLARQHYTELRAELAALRGGLNFSDLSDQTRVERIDEILKDHDRFFELTESERSAAPARKGARP